MVTTGMAVSSLSSSARSTPESMMLPSVVSFPSSSGYQACSWTEMRPKTPPSAGASRSPVGSLSVSLR